jgi:probable rRNA maturation factor
MLHLFGYDHMNDEERAEMENLQEKILTMKGYTRDYEEE